MYLQATAHLPATANEALLDDDGNHEFPQVAGAFCASNVAGVLNSNAVCQDEDCQGTNAEAQDYGFVNWLGVTEGYQGGGLGKWLLLRTRNEMLERGYRHTAISTAVSNHRAFLFYSNYGYRVVDWTYGLSKSLLED